MSNQEDRQVQDEGIESETMEADGIMDSSGQDSTDNESFESDAKAETTAADTDEVSETAKEEGEATSEAQIKSLQEQLAAAKQEVDKQKDLALRAKAEEQNARRRARIDVEKAHKYSIEKFGRELLSVIDSLERAVESVELNNADDTVKAILEGVELTLKMFQDAFKKFNLEQINPEGEPFDPQLHQAISTQENDNVEPNTILTVVQKGYILSERTLRPAMVIVSKASTNTSSKIDEKA